MTHTLKYLIIFICPDVLQRLLKSMDYFKAMDLLHECDGDGIWSADYCRKRGIPETIIQRLLDRFESNFSDVSQTIFIEKQQTNQYAGVRDVDIALWLAEELGFDTTAITTTNISRAVIVREIREAIEEG